MSEAITLKLIQYYYNELPLEDHQAIEKQLALDATLREKLEEIKSSVSSLDKMNFSPSDSCLKNIMDHNRSEEALEQLF